MAKPKFKIVFLDKGYFPSIQPMQEAVAGIGGEIIDVAVKTDEDIIAAAKDADVVLNILPKVQRRAIESFERCKLITRMGIGYDEVDVEAATEKGIMVCNVADYCQDEVSDHALTLLLCAVRKVKTFDENMRKGKWGFRHVRPIHEIRGKTLGLVAFGKIPRCLAPKAQGLGLKVIAYDPYLYDDIFAKWDVERRLDLDVLMAESDFVSIHAPFSRETKGMIGEAEFRQMKPTAYFVNTSRGPVVNEEALLKALHEGWIAGAALDVMVEEPLPTTSPLMQAPNLILTPHASWYTERAVGAVVQNAMADVVRALQGKRPKNLVNPQVLWK
ncbi:MAG: C-terminal binding protein [bacterium]|jgi:D-3-phosphoglycerate dehydrogenase